MEEAKGHGGGSKGGGHGGAAGGHGHEHGDGSHEEHEGAPEWLISFADNVTLMMGFFVILLAMNLKPAGGGAGEGKAEAAPAEPPPALLDAAIAIRDAFNNPVDLSSLDPNDLALIRRIRQRSAEGDTPVPGSEGYEQDVQSIRPTNYFSPGCTVQFDDRSSTLSLASEQTVGEVAEFLSGRRWIIDVRGHCSVEEAFEQPEEGLRLSYERAMAVARVLVANGISWNQVRILSCGDNDQVEAHEYEPGGPAPNRRVEVIVTEEVMPDHLQ